MNTDFHLLDRIPVGAFIVDRDLSVRYWNPCMEDWTGITSPEIVGSALTVFYPVFNEERYSARFISVFNQGTPVILTYRLHGNLFPTRNPSCIDRVYHTSITFLECGEPSALFTLEDRTEVSNRIREAREELGKRIETEKLLHAALEEKNILFREIHHRVKNNLNTIISLIDLQMDSSVDEATSTHLRDLAARIRSFSLLHETLYRKDTYNTIDAADYLGSVAESLQLSAGQEDIHCELELSSTVMSVKRALYLGLALVELMTNAMKYGRSKDNSTTMQIALVPGGDGTCELRVRDYGQGLTANATSGTVNSLGIRLVRMMTDELAGVIRFEAPEGGGAMIAIRFNIESQRRE